MKKYKFWELALEVTRRCNKACPHCVKGAAQNLSMSTEIIDKIFEDVADAAYLVLLSGEVLLEIDLIEYIVQKLANSQWTTRAIEFTTNGTVRDKRIIDTLEEYCSRKEGNAAFIRISNDQFHDPEEYVQAYNFYTDLANQANARNRTTNRSGGIFVDYTQIEGNKIPALTYDGNAINFINSGESGYIRGINVKYPHNEQHRIRIDGDTIPCLIGILANGGVFVTEQMSYDSSDKCSFGNIMDSHLTDIIDQHNNNCVVLCSETNVMDMCKFRTHDALLPTLRGNQHLSFMDLHAVFCNRIIELREKAKQLFTHIPVQDIITAMPFPDDNEIRGQMFDIYEHSPYYNRDLVKKLFRPDKQEKVEYYQNAMIQAILTYLKDQNKRRYPYDLFGDDNDILKSMSFRLFAELEKYYASNPSEAKNDYVFDCKPNQYIYGINYGKTEVEDMDFDKEIDERIIEKLQSRKTNDTQ